MRDSSRFRPWLTIAEKSKVQRHGQGIPLREITGRRRRGPWRWATGGKAEMRAGCQLPVRSDVCFKRGSSAISLAVRSGFASGGYSSSKREHVVPLRLTCGDIREGSRPACSRQARDSGGRCRAGRLRRSSTQWCSVWVARTALHVTVSVWQRCSIAKRRLALPTWTAKTPSQRAKAIVLHSARRGQGRRARAKSGESWSSAGGKVKASRRAGRSWLPPAQASLKRRAARPFRSAKLFPLPFTSRKHPRLSARLPAISPPSPPESLHACLALLFSETRCVESCLLAASGTNLIPPPRQALPRTLPSHTSIQPAWSRPSQRPSLLPPSNSRPPSRPSSSLASPRRRCSRCRTPARQLTT